MPVPPLPLSQLEDKQTPPPIAAMLASDIAAWTTTLSKYLNSLTACMAHAP